MKVKNLKAKCFIIPVGGKKAGFLLAPGSGYQELPKDIDEKYIEALESNGCIDVAVTETSKPKAKQK